MSVADIKVKIKSDVITAIATLDEIKGESDKETHENIKTIIGIMEGKFKGRVWPSMNLCKIVYGLKDSEKFLFLSVLKDMDEALTEAEI